jgi:para-aminobenzoate synthetase
MKTLLIDNYDSFTYNLFQLIAEANGEEPLVVRNDEASWEELVDLPYENIVISPGPGRPDRVADFGVCARAISEATAPLLGVCLGHQGLGWLAGGQVVHAPEVMHGRLSAVIHEESPLFDGIPREFSVVRYHSLCVAQPLPDELEPIAWTPDGVLMAVAHRTRPQWGVQFHPESISTSYGRRLLANFGRLASERSDSGPARPERRSEVRWPTGHGRGPRTGQTTPLRLAVKRLDALVDAERAFSHLYGDREDAFWLDSSRHDARSRFSFIGAGGGPLSALISYDVAEQAVRVQRGEETELVPGSIFDYLSGEMRRLRLRSDELPFDFNGGFVGYFGYELKADCGGSDRHQADSPDAMFLFADRLIAFDHVERCTYVLCVHVPGDDEEAERWIRETTLRIVSLPSAPEPDTARADAGEAGPTQFTLSRSHQQYLQDIAHCHQCLVDGESYEICLTNKVTADVRPEPLSLYRTLRRVNPAPFSAFLRYRDVSVLSSSPERFLSIGRDRWAEAKPIKGTCPRGETPAEDVRLAEELRSDVKSRAENLMIADLLRNDLGRVCEVGTVHVPSLMHIESYETVHQLVSTVRGLLRDDIEPPDCIRACFPGGSMTGAPKKRTMEIIDELEGEARGVYSGAIGYLGLSGGCDLNIVIRTIVIDARRTSLGVGGAIVMQSDPEEEYRETVLKARAPMLAIDPAVDPYAALEAAGETDGTEDSSRPVVGR